MAGREGVQHAGSDAGWRLGRRDSGLNLDPKRPRPTDVRNLLSDCDTVLERVGVSVRFAFCSLGFSFTEYIHAASFSMW